MGETHSNAVNRLNGIAGYRALFEKSFASPEVTIDNAAKAIATFERTLLSGHSAFDRYKAGNKTALTASQARGMDVYFNKAKCDSCHEGVNLTANAYLEPISQLPMRGASRSPRIRPTGANSRHPRCAIFQRPRPTCTMAV